MARQVKIPTHERGEISALLVQSHNGIWESEWDSLRGTIYEGLVTKVDFEILEQALQGWSRPLSEALGLPPVGSIKKLPIEAKQCSQKQTCPFHDKHCQAEHRQRPPCYMPGGVVGDVQETLTRALDLWKLDVYILVVERDGI
jgi:hypothetical protein